MTNLGFTHYDEAPVSAKPTTQELIASLSDGNRGKILQGFIDETDPDDLAHRIFEDKGVIKFLYRKMIVMKTQSYKRMRGEILITEAIRDAEGEITTPAVYNTPPATSDDLIAEIEADLNNEFTTQQVTAILTKMVQQSKHDGTGTWAFYRTEVIK